MRTDVKERIYRVFTYQEVDRVPDIEFGYWPQTVRRWLKEGLSLDLTQDEINSMWSPKLMKFFGFEQEGHGIPANVWINPAFEVKIIEDKGDTRIVRDALGGVREFFVNPDKESIPRYIKFPVETPEDWQRMKERYRLDDPVRKLPTEAIENARRAQAAGQSIAMQFCGFYGQLREWMGMENLSMAFYDYPEMVHNMVEHWSEMILAQIEQVPADIPIDCVGWWEDMACKSGPLVSPKIFREFLQPGYHRVMTVAKKRGADISSVDSDGNPHDIVANWLEEGVNIMYPLEVAAGVDPYAWRKEFGMELRLQGGVAKVPLVEGRKAIDKEMERLRPLVEQGGFVPHVDHLVPPNVSYDNFRYYLDKKRKLIGK